MHKKTASSSHVVPAQKKSRFEKYRGIGTPGIGIGKKAAVRWVKNLRGR